MSDSHSEMAEVDPGMLATTRANGSSGLYREGCIQIAFEMFMREHMKSVRVEQYGDSYRSAQVRGFWECFRAGWRDAELMVCKLHEAPPEAVVAGWEKQVEALCNGPEEIER